MSVVEENEVARLVDDGTFYIVEDKTMLNKPIHLQSNTETWKTMFVDWTRTEEGKFAAIRFYLPKTQFDFEVARNVFDSITKARRKELEKLKELAEQYRDYLGAI
jgi:hypothetical protein